jgi:hypothetical protein
MLLAVTKDLGGFDAIDIDLHINTGDSDALSLCANGMMQRSVISSALKEQRYSSLPPVTGWRRYGQAGSIPKYKKNALRKEENLSTGGVLYIPYEGN